MEVLFHVETGKTISFVLDPSILIYEVIIKLSDVLKIPRQDISLVFNKKKLSPSMKIKDYGIKEKSVIKVNDLSQNDDFLEKHPKKKVSKRHQALPPRRVFNLSSEDPPHFESMVTILEDMGFERELCETALRVAFYNPDRAAEYLIEQNIPNEPCKDVQDIQRQRDKLCTDIDNLVSTLNEHDKEAIRRLSKTFDKDDVLQVYIICEKDEEKSREMLESFK